MSAPAHEPRWWVAETFRDAGWAFLGAGVVIACGDLSGLFVIALLDGLWRVQGLSLEEILDGPGGRHGR